MQPGLAQPKLVIKSTVVPNYKEYNVEIKLFVKNANYYCPNEGMLFTRFCSICRKICNHGYGRFQTILS